MSVINFEDRKNKLNNESSFEENWKEIDEDAAARGAAILLNGGNTDFGKMNYSFTAEKDVEELRKQASFKSEFRNRLENDPEYRKAALEIEEALEDFDEELSEKELEALENE